MASIQDTIGNYRLVAELASGGFGHVYRAEHAILTNRVVAIKLMHAVHLNSQKERDSFIQEALLLEQLQHPYILPIVDVGLHEGSPYMVTEFAPNGSLRDRLERQSHKPLLEEEAITILSQIGQALQHAHQQKIVHRDLKPENILFNVKGEAVLADFGISTVLGTLTLQKATIVGTPPYMAPEQFRGTISKASDQYALGCIAYELFTGRQPFKAPDFFSIAFKHLQEAPIAPRQLNAQVPVYIEQAILKAMAKGRSERHVDVSAFMLALCKTKQQWLYESEVHYEATRYIEALAACEQALRLDRNDAHGYYNKGQALQALKRDAEAILAYEQAIQLDPNDALAYHNMGQALYNLKRYEEALAAYKHAIGLNPNNAHAYYNKGLALRGLQRDEEAILAYEQALRLEPHNVFVWLYKGWTLTALGRYEEALAIYEHTIRLDPNSALAHNNKGAALYDLKRYEEAVLAYEHALRLDPHFALAYYNMGNTLYDLQCDEEALTAYEHALRLDPHFALAYNGKGTVLSDLEHYQEALTAYEHALRIDPNFALAYYNKGLVLSDLRLYQEALVAYEHALDLDPNSAKAYYDMGLTLERLKRTEEALAAHSHALRLDPNYANAYHHKGNMLKQLGRTKEAQQAYEHARQLGYGQ